MHYQYIRDQIWARPGQLLKLGQLLKPGQKFVWGQLWGQNWGQANFEARPMGPDQARFYSIPPCKIDIINGPETCWLNIPPLSICFLSIFVLMQKPTPFPSSQVKVLWYHTRYNITIPWRVKMSPFLLFPISFTLSAWMRYQYLQIQGKFPFWQYLSS